MLFLAICHSDPPNEAVVSEWVQGNHHCALDTLDNWGCCGTNIARGLWMLWNCIVKLIETFTCTANSHLVYIHHHFLLLHFHIYLHDIIWSAFWLKRGVGCKKATFHRQLVHCQSQQSWEITLNMPDNFWKMVEIRDVTAHFWQPSSMYLLLDHTVWCNNMASLLLLWQTWPSLHCQYEGNWR